MRRAHVMVTAFVMTLGLPLVAHAQSNEVAHQDDEGRKTHGRLLSLTGDQIQVKWQSGFRHRQRTFTETTVRRVEIQDSTWNGALIGLGVGSAVAGLGCMLKNGGQAVFFAVLLAPGLGLGLGDAMDASINRPMHEAPGDSTTTLAPILGPGRIGLSARVRF